MATRPQRSTDTLHRDRWTQDGRKWTYGALGIIQGPDDALWRLDGINPAHTQRMGDELRAWKDVKDAMLHIERNYVVLVVQNDHTYKGKKR